MIGVITLSKLIGFSGWILGFLTLLLSIPYALVGTVFGHKLRCALVPEYAKAYSGMYRYRFWHRFFRGYFMLPFNFMLPFTYFLIVSFIVFKFF